MIKNLGTEEIILISVVLIILFGSKKIPELLRGIAQAINEFRYPKKDNEEEEKV